ncbi:NAD-dependent succinate-semialdehyde dehydrogenase [Salinicoccus sp. HZC-1]|uniref:NAD-dependent succinate-semialdehyde dehydrogenase n=1 Tax=Salinicoccus sp. HZC-1 TaxID=3385497 RepID=UPI00398A692B
MFINGEWVKADDSESFSVVNPSTNKVIASVPKGKENETKMASEAADHAFKGWASLTAKERSAYLLRIRELMIEYKSSLAEIMSLEMGKPYKEGLKEVDFSASYLEWYAAEGQRIYGEMIPSSAPDKRLSVIKQPIGVVAAITPWNFPLAMFARKLAPAMAAGCTTIIKPASQSPLTALAFGKILEISELPRGVVNIVTGSASAISEEIFSNDIVKKISFTGSTEVGKSLVVKSATHLKRLSLELGGHAPFIVFEDADIDLAVDGAIESKFRNTGQTCVCANRIYVQKSIMDEFSKAFVEKVKELKVGDSLVESNEVGPLVSADGLDKANAHVKDAIESGAKLLIGGKKLEEASAEGFFYEPTVMSGVNHNMLITREETFGPVAPLIEFESEEEVIEYANSTEYGLAAYFFTNDGDRAIRVSEALDFGVIGYNDGLPTVAQAPFGGLKESGMGKEGGHHGIEEYLEEKFISRKLK